MQLTMRAVAVVAVLTASVAGSGRAATDGDPWRLKLEAVAAHTTGGDTQDTSYGGGVALEYRLSPRLGLELGVVTAEPKSEVELDFLPETLLHLDSSFRMTPLMARVDLHLTPGARADLYVSPVAAYVKMSTLTVRAHGQSEGQDFVAVDHFDLEDKLTWGLGLGLDVPVGGSRSFLSLGATYLRLPLSFKDSEGFLPGSDVNPVFVQAAYGVRF